jgi:hypothetical protein
MPTGLVELTVGQPGGALGFAFGFRPSSGYGRPCLFGRSGFGRAFASHAAEFSESHCRRIFHFEISP